MDTYTQAGRPFRVSSKLGADALLLLGFRGVEGVSRPFEFTVDLLSLDARIDADVMLGEALRLELSLPDGGARYIHGRIRRFVQLGRHEGLVSYRAEIVPTLRLLELGTDCRIFQNKSVLDIAREVFGEQGLTDFEVRCTSSYAPREYCVQYRETHLGFVSRLLEEEGICYFFEHQEDRHVLVLADAPSAFRPLPEGGRAELVVAEGKWYEHDVVTTFERDHVLRTGRVTYRNYDFLQPSLTLEGSVADTRPGELYDYPVKFTKIEEGNRYARLRLEQLESLQQVVRGSGNMRSFVPGYCFDLAGHYRSDANRGYALLEVSHECTAGDVRTWAQAETQYTNTFTAIPRGTVYRPERRTPRPVVHGTQTALCVGPAGQELHLDKYARVKIQFYWDRLGARDDRSSCWVRVSSSIAGKGFGGVSHPRVGQECVVDFLEGDPDQPLVVGRVYNAEQMPPYEMPGQATVSGLLGKSTPNGSGTANEIRFCDGAGREAMYIHAKKDKKVKVENDSVEEVDGFETLTIKKDRKKTVEGAEAVAIQKDSTKSVTGRESVEIGKDHSTSVGGNLSISIGMMKNELVAASSTETVGIAKAITVGGAMAISVGAAMNVAVLGQAMEEVGTKKSISAGESIELTCGAASIRLEASGCITLSGNPIHIVGGSLADIKATEIRLN